jgi:hypothetical protein
MQGVAGLRDSAFFWFVATITFFVMIMLHILAVFSSALISGFFMMIVAEIISNETSGLFPALGYFTSVSISFIMTFIVVAGNRLAAVRSIDANTRQGA